MTMVIAVLMRTGQIAWDISLKTMVADTDNVKISENLKDNHKATGYDAQLLLIQQMQEVAEEEFYEMMLSNFLRVDFYRRAYASGIECASTNNFQKCCRVHMEE